MTCEYCDIISGKKKTANIYADDVCTAFLSEQPATIGHIIVIPNNHLPIIEALDNNTTYHIFRVVNKLSIAVFESIKCEGTNLIVHNGVDAGQDQPHLSINIVPRNPDDGLSFDWEPKHLTQQEMTTIEMKIKQEMGPYETGRPKWNTTEKDHIGAEEKKDAGPATAVESAGTGKSVGQDDDKHKTEKQETKTPEESYLLKQLRRMP